MKNKNFKILIIGFGSIGKRHWRNLHTLGYERVAVFDPDERQFAGLSVQRVAKITPDILKKFTIAFICNPTNLHLKTALRCAKAGCNLFIEKPLSHTLKGIAKLESAVKSKKIIAMVGCNMRFHPCLMFMKRYLEEKKLGKVYSIRHDCGFYLPWGRAGRDYRKTYAAKKSFGGGVILDDIHEFDLLFWLNDFRRVANRSLLFAKASDLEIETEDQAAGIFLFDNNVMGVVASDYLQRRYSRTCKIVGEKGNLVWDFQENAVVLQNKEKQKVLFQAKKYDTNKMYVDEITYFLSCVKRGKETFNSVQKAHFLLRNVIAK